MANRLNLSVIALVGALALPGAAAALPTLDVDFGALGEGVVTDTRNISWEFGGQNPVSEVKWYGFTVGTLAFVDIDTNGSNFNSIIGLYTASGDLVATDNDGGLGSASVLSFGTGSGLTLGDSGNLGGNGIAEGEDGALGPGTYFLAVTRNEFIRPTFGATGFAVDPAFTSEVEPFDDEVTVTIRTGGATVVPLPAAGWMLLAGAGGLGAAARRRRRAG